jgi:undecaprenyl-diphosphatase
MDSRLPAGSVPGDLIAGFVGAAGALILFGWLAQHVARHATIQFDTVIRDGLHAHASPSLTLAFRTITYLGSELVLVPVVALVVWRLMRRGRRQAATLLVLATAGAEVLDTLLKLIFRRTRPAVFFGLVAPQSYSFPSGHSMLSACVYGVIAAVLTARMTSRGKSAAIWAAAVFLALAIGTSRIYLGVHYPSDVAAGYAAAVIWVAAVRAGYALWLRRRGAT